MNTSIFYSFLNKQKFAIFNVVVLSFILMLSSPVNAQNPNCDVHIPDIVFDELSIVNASQVDYAHSLVSYSCHNPTSQGVYINACFLLKPTSQGQEFIMSSADGYHLSFQLRHALTQEIWNYDSVQPAFGFSGQINAGETISGEFPIKAELLTPIETMPASHYSAQITGADSAILLEQNPFTAPLSCQSGSLMSGFTLNVKANILSSCEINATDMNFGKILPTQQRYSAYSQIKLTCTPNTAYQIMLTSQQASGGSFKLLARDVNGEINSIDYQLFNSSNPADVWLPGVVKESFVADNNEAVINLQGVINQPSNEFAPGVYKDTVTVTLYY